MSDKTRNILFIILGILCVVVGTVAIVVPGLPTTPFILLSSWLFYRSSDRFHGMLKRSFLNRYIERYESKEGVSWKAKLVSILLMWTMVTISSIFFLKSNRIRVVVFILVTIGTCFVIFTGKGRKK